MLAPAPNPLSFMVADFFISAHMRNMLGELYVRRDGRFTPNFILNLTTTPLGVINCHFHFAGRTPVPNPLSFMVVDFFISAHRRDILGKLYVHCGGHLNLTLCKVFY